MLVKIVVVGAVVLVGWGIYKGVKQSNPIGQPKRNIPPKNEEREGSKVAPVASDVVVKTNSPLTETLTTIQAKKEELNEVNGEIKDTIGRLGEIYQRKEKLIDRIKNI